MAAIPTSLALTNVADDAEIIASDHRNNYAAIQTAVNALITALASGTSGQVLISDGAAALHFGDAGSSSQEVEGILPAAGTTATAGTGFTYTHTNGTGVYVMTFSSSFLTAPAVTATALAADTTITVSAVDATHATFNLTDHSNVAKDAAFNFRAKVVS